VGSAAIRAFARKPLAGGCDTKQMLLETQVRIAREPIRIRSQGPHKVLNLPLHFAFAPGTGDFGAHRWLLSSAHFLHPREPVTAARTRSRTHRSKRVSFVGAASAYPAKLLAERGESIIYVRPQHLSIAPPCQSPRGRDQPRGHARNPPSDGWPAEPCHSSADTPPFARNDPKDAPPPTAQTATGSSFPPRRGS
jgi:hypothetical protein